MLFEEKKINDVITKDKNIIMGFIMDRYSEVVDLKNREKLVKSLYGKATGDELFKIYNKISKCMRVSEKALRTSLLDEIMKSKCSSETIKEIVPNLKYLSSLKVIGNMPLESIKILLSQLIVICDYETAISIIVKNNLEEELLEAFINQVIMLNDLYNKIFDTAGPNSLFELLRVVCKFDYSNQFKTNVSEYKDIIEEEIVKSKDIKTIIKTGIYLDPYILSYTFETKRELIEYLVLNEYNADEIALAVKSYYNVSDKEEINGKVTKKLESFNNELSSKKEDRFTYHYSVNK